VGSSASLTDLSASAPSRPRAARGLAVAVVLINLFVAGMAWRSLQVDRHAEVERAGQALTNLTRVLSENLEGTIAQIDLALLATVDALEEPGAGRTAWRRHVEQTIQQHTGRLPFIDAVRVTDAAGTLFLGEGLDAEEQPVVVADRDYFLAAKARRTAGMVVSNPLVDWISRNRAIIFARAWHRPDGGFAGVASATVSAVSFTLTLARIRAPYDGAIVLRGGDNAVIARYPDVASAESVVGKREISPELTGILASDRTEALYEAVSPVEHRPALVAFRRVSGSPFYVLVTAAPETFLAGWRAQARRTAGAVALFAALSALAAWVLLTALRSESESRFRALVLGAPIAVALVRGTRLLFVNRAFLETFGLADAAQALGRSLADVVHPSEVARIADRLARRMRALPVDATLEVVAQGRGGAPIRVAVTDAAVDIRGGPAVVAFFQDVTAQRHSQEERERLIGELKRALAEVKTLSGLLPICSHCKRIRDDRGYWNRIETYIRERSEAEFTHGICPECAHRFFGKDDEGGGEGTGSAGR